MVKLAANKGTMSEVAILHQLPKSFSALLFDAAWFKDSALSLGTLFILFRAWVPDK